MMIPQVHPMMLVIQHPRVMVLMHSLLFEILAINLRHYYYYVFVTLFEGLTLTNNVNYL